MIFLTPAVSFGENPYLNVANSFQTHIFLFVFWVYLRRLTLATESSEGSRIQSEAKVHHSIKRVQGSQGLN